MSPQLSSQSRLLRLLPLALLAIVICVYLPSLRNGFIWDDETYVINNATLRTAAGLADIWLRPSTTPQYYPLVHTSFWIEFQLWGLNPTGYHADNILLHAIACVLLLNVLWKMGVKGAGWAALLFAVHPVMTESVAWITERKNVLSAVFTLLAMRSAITAWQLDDPQDLSLPSDDASPKQPNRAFAYCTCLAFFTAALLSKTVACTFPLVVLLIIYWRRQRVRWGEVIALIPFLTLGIALGLLTAWLERNHVGASGSEFNLSIAGRLLLAGRVVCFYFAKLLYPWRLIFIYPHWSLSPTHPLQWTASLIVVAAMLSSWIARIRIGRGAFVLMGIYGVTLFPALGFVDVYPFRYSFVADHFQYLAATAVFIAIGWCWSHVLHRVGMPVGVGTLVILSLLTWRRQAAYADLRALWTDTANQNASAWIAWNNLGILDFDAGDMQSAVSHFKKAAVIKPDVNPLQANMGIALLRLHRAAEAEATLSLAVAQYPDDAVAWHALGNSHVDCGHDYLANIAFERSARLNPYDTETLADLAWLKATSIVVDVHDPIAALKLARLAEARSNGYSIRAVETESAADAAMGHFAQASAESLRAASMAGAAGDQSRAESDRNQAASFANGVR